LKIKNKILKLNEKNYILMNRSYKRDVFKLEKKLLKVVTAQYRELFSQPIKLTIAQKVNLA
jgi:hypothetical protein